jgi:hypothetical protein
VWFRRVRFVIFAPDSGIMIAAVRQKITYRSVQICEPSSLIKRTGTLRYAFDAEAKSANLTGTKNPVLVMLTIGDDSGATSVKADIDH